MSYGVYIGVKSARYSNGIASCIVLDSQISTGNALVYNLETERLQIVTPPEREYLMDAVKSLVRDREHLYIKKIAKELSKNYIHF